MYAIDGPLFYIRRVPTTLQNSRTLSDGRRRMEGRRSKKQRSKMEEAEAEAGATKQPTYPKVAVFNLGRAHVWWWKEQRSTSLSGARFKWTDWIGEEKTGNRCGTRARRRHTWQLQRRRCGNSTNR